MRDVLQNGRHPDADQLSAFAEQALPVHEREAMLAHLAVCSECRAWLALAQGVAAPVAAPARKPARKLWFGGWTFAWSAAAAVAGLALFAVVYVHRAKFMQSGGSEHAQVTAVRPPAPVLQAERAQNQAAAPPAPAQRQASHRTSSAREEAGNQLMAVEKTRQQAAAVPPPAARMNPLDAGIGGVKQNELAPGAAAAFGANQISNKPIQAPAAIHPLPSGLPAISAVLRDGQMLAIDSAHALFLSQDGGAHWNAVAVPWKARAVKLSLVSATANKKVEPQSANAQRDTEADADKFSATSTTGGLAGTITDVTGAVIPGASVAVKDAAGHTSRTVQTGSNGRYAVNGLAPGTYDVEAHALGFKTARLSAVSVVPSRRNVADMKLDVGTSSQTVMVTSGSESLETAPLSRAKAPSPPAAAQPPAAPPAQALPAPAPAAPPSAFEISLDDGSRWTSADGMNWTRE